ncbi:MAG: UPF0149 family protein [Pseudomonadota bacterium]
MSELKHLAAQTRRSISAAELHGAACGVAVSGPEQASAMALVALLGEDALTDQDAVAGFLNQTVAELTAPDLTFDLLLADVDDVGADGTLDLDALPEALSQWCAAFVAGLVAGLPRGEPEAASDDAQSQDQWDALQQLGPDAQEVVSDMLAIAQLEHESEDLDEDEREAALTELVEYVRVAVLLLLAPPADDVTDA